MFIKLAKISNVARKLLSNTLTSKKEIAMAEAISEI